MMDEVRQVANSKTRGLGVSVVDVRLKKVELPEDVRDSVYQRMEKERAKIAREIRSQGNEQAKKIRAEAERQRSEILSRAYSQSEQTRGQGDATSARVYADAYSANREFYNLYRSLNAYQAAFANNRDVLLLNPDSDFFKYFNSSQPLGGTQ
jgi:membrane protease subunit HflC